VACWLLLSGSLDDQQNNTAVLDDKTTPVEIQRSALVRLSKKKGRYYAAM